MFLKHAYAGSQNVRKISASDFKSAGVEGQTQVEWNPKNKHIAELSDAAGQWLTDNEPGDWEVVDDASSVEGASSSSSGSGEDAEGSPGEGTAPITTGARARRSS